MSPLLVRSCTVLDLSRTKSDFEATNPPRNGKPGRRAETSKERLAHGLTYELGGVGHNYVMTAMCVSAKRVDVNINAVHLLQKSGYIVLMVTIDARELC